MNNYPAGANTKKSPWNDKMPIDHYPETPKCPIHNDEMDKTQWGWECKHWEEGCMEAIEINDELC